MTDERMPTACGERRRGLNAASVEPRHVSGHVAALRASALLTLALAVALVAPARADSGMSAFGQKQTYGDTPSNDRNWG